jgi:chromosome segregation ATPase
VQVETFASKTIAIEGRGSMSTWRSVGIVVIVAAGITATVASGQTQRSPATIDDLLAEVRALRADLSQANGASVRAQFLVARLSLQEQRISTLGRELTEVQSQVDTVVRERTHYEERFKKVDGVLSADSVASGERRDVQAMADQARAALSQAQAREQRLRTQASELLTLMTTEQNRWTEFNGRLDDLERSLPTGRPAR